MSKVLTWINPVVKRGTPHISVVTFHPDFLARFSDDEAAIDDWKSKKLQYFPGAVGFETQEATALITKELFRDNWIRLDGKVAVDMVEARKTHMNDIRAGREIEYARLNLDVNLARGDQTKLDATYAEIDILKDIPQRDESVLDSKLTPEDLKDYWPAELPDRT